MLEKQEHFSLEEQMNDARKEALVLAMMALGMSEIDMAIVLMMYEVDNLSAFALVDEIAGQVQTVLDAMPAIDVVSVQLT